MIEGCLASGGDDPVPASHHTLWFRGHTPLFLQEKKDFSAEMRWKYWDRLDYLAGLSTYARLPNMNILVARHSGLYVLLSFNPKNRVILNRGFSALL